MLERKTPSIGIITTQGFRDRLELRRQRRSSLYDLFFQKPPPLVSRHLRLEVPERAICIRVIVSELNRIASHLVSLGTYGLDIGAITPFLYAFREREMILDLLEAVCGARLTYSYITPGGVHRICPKVSWSVAGSSWITSSRKSPSTTTC